MVTDVDDLINAAEVAEVLGLAHRNSVSTYRSRYPDFPQGQPAPGGGRTRLWSRAEIIAWRDRFRGDSDSGEHPRLDDLVAATARLMLANPGTEISIRQIAAEAGVAHSDLYRYASSKEQLQQLAVDRINDEFASAFPDSFEALVENLEPIIAAIRARRSPMRVIAHQQIVEPTTVASHQVAVAQIPALVRDWRARQGIESELDERVLAAGLAALTWGIVLFADRWLGALGLETIPDEQVALMAKRLLTA
ncbi:MAG TPA: TetR/AcrR family transcriptional regulator [Candidatus Nanopelagicales bacterium]